MSLRIGCRVADADKHGNDVTCLLFKKGKLYSGADDGKIKAWSMDLKKLAEVQAHPQPVYSMAASNDTIFSCSSDGTVKAFKLDTLEPTGRIIHEDHTEFWKVCHSENCLYAGDDEGTLKIWKNGKFFGSLLTAEPIKDMVVCHHTVFTVKDSDVTITEVKVDGNTLQFGVKKCYMGRAPVSLIGDHLFAFVSRDGKDILLHENNEYTHYDEITKVQGAHEMVINALAGTTWRDKAIMYSGGWDKQIKKWFVDEDIVKTVSTINTDMVVNALVVGDKGEIYAGGSDGRIIRLE